ncbi:hypothetical protein [Burkholderia guangdongensis]|uniref:hypothetical protein n=1 Tax=Burkholderia guangdongensis TaxID=1792500 RepID=UPI0015CB6176|nr:hypothetical protein [Burkholderia guangdongensis]
MTQFRAASVVLAVSIGIALLHAPAAFAQNSAQDSAPAAAPATVAPAGASMSRQDLKAQRKARRKAARAKRNADLSAIEKNGYRLTGDQTNYPENLQNAERKAADQKKGAAGASSPAQ